MKPFQLLMAARPRRMIAHAALLQGLALALFAGAAYAHHCAGGYWLGGGGGYVSPYVEQRWGDCVSGVGRQASWEEWVGAQYGCVGHYYKRNSPTQQVYVKIYQCVKTSATAGYCTWSDGSHSDSVTAAHYCPSCAADNKYWNGNACVMGNGDGSNLGGPTCPSVHEGNPIHARTGNKYQHEVDYVGRGPFPLRFERHYNSFVGKTPYNWRHSYDRRLKVNSYGIFGQVPYQWIVNTAKVLIVRPDGRELNFTKTVDVSTNYQLTDGTFLEAALYMTERLEKVAGGFKLYTSDDGTELYSSTGRLLSIADRHGRVQELAYDANGRLSVVRDPAGNELTLTYTSQGYLLTMTDPAGGLHEYAHDASTRLASVTYPDGTIRAYLYANATYPHLLTGIVDENGQQFAQFSYTAQGRANVSKHAGDANKVTLVFNANGTTTVTDALGTARTRSFADAFGFYRNAGTTVPCANCGSNSQTVTYDANGFMDARTDFNGNVTDYGYNSRGLEESRTEAHGTPLARISTTQWHPTFRLPTQVDEPGRRTTYTYDANGNRLTQTVTDLVTSESRTTAWTYNALGQVLTINGPRTDVSDVTTYTYYECSTGGQCGQVHTITNALGHVSEITDYDAHGKPLAIEDPNGVTTTLTYDLRQRLKTRTVAGATTRFDYDGVGQLDKVTLPGGAFLDYTYDGAHRLTDIEDNAGNRIHYTLDLLGNRTQEDVKDPSGSIRRTQSQVFDTLGRLDQIKNAAGQITTDYGYDAQGNRTSQIDYSAVGVGHTTTFTPDALNRIRQVTDPVNGVTKYGYNALDQLVSVEDPRSLTTTYTVNALGDAKQQASPDTGSTQYPLHDAAGNRKRQLDARGVQVDYEYDVLNRLTVVDYPGTAEDVTYSYDSASQPYGKGRLTGVTDESGTTTLVYDARGNVTQESRVIGGTTYVTGYGYDLADRLISISYPTARIVTYTRNALGQVTKVESTVGSTTTTVADSIQYMPFGGIKSYTLGNGVVVTRTHDLDYRLEKLKDQGGTTIGDVNVYYDLRGNVESLEDVLETGRSQTLDYDALSRLTFAEGAYGDRGYGYDAVGNRLAETATPPGTTDTYTYPPTSHRLQSQSSGTGYTYDLAGSITAKGSLSLTYNNAHRASTIALGDTTVTNLYNASGQRVRKAVGSEQTTFHYDRAGQLIAETGSGGLLIQREYVWLEGIALAVLAETSRPTVVTDNTAPSFSSTGAWTSTSSAPGYEGSDYLTHTPVGNPSGTQLMDDLDAGTSKTGIWVALTGTPPGYQGIGYQRSSFSLSQNTFAWSVPLITPGNYRVYARWVSDASYSTDARYTVTHANGSATHSVNQTSGGGSWYLLGTYAFGTTASISLSDPAGGTLIADAVRLIPVTALTDMAAWTAPEAQSYEVYARWPAAAHHAKRAVYTITHASGTTDAIRDQSQSGGQWSSLGTYTFGSAAQGIQLRVDPDATTVADAIRFVPTGASVTQATTAYAHVDHLGTTQKMTDAAQQVVWQATYEPFGQATLTKQPYYDNPLRFPGQYFDAETGLHQNWWRDYDPTIGRYLQADPLGLYGGDLSTYLYARDNPLVYTDPTGESAEVLAGAAAAPKFPAPPPVLVGLASFGGGYLAGSWLYPHIEPVITPVVDYCLMDSDSETDESCEALYRSILRTCASLSGRKKFQCFEAARKSREQCYQERGR